MELGKDAVLTLPLWGTLTLVGGVLASFATFIWWTFVTFYRKTEALELERRFDDKIKEVKTDVKEVDNSVHELTASQARIASDVSYIRGRLEPRE